MKDGWHTICGYSVYVEDGKIKRGMKESDTLTAYVYRWNKSLSCWTKESDITPDAFRAGIKRGTITLT